MQTHVKNIPWKEAQILLKFRDKTEKQNISFMCKSFGIKYKFYRHFANHFTCLISNLPFLSWKNLVCDSKTCHVCQTGISFLDSARCSADGMVCYYVVYFALRVLFLLLDLLGKASYHQNLLYFMCMTYTSNSETTFINLPWTDKLHIWGALLCKAPIAFKLWWLIIRKWNA